MDGVIHLLRLLFMVHFIQVDFFCATEENTIRNSIFYGRNQRRSQNFWIEQWRNKG